LAEFDRASAERFSQSDDRPKLRIKKWIQTFCDGVNFPDQQYKICHWFGRFDRESKGDRRLATEPPIVIRHGQPGGPEEVDTDQVSG